VSGVPAKLAQNSAAAKKRGRGGNSFSPNPFSFPPRPRFLSRPLCGRAAAKF